jgi:hypothetical protein
LRSRRWLAVAIATAWLGLAALAYLHEHAHAVEQGHCATCQWVRCPVSVAPRAANIAPPAPHVVIVAVHERPAPPRIATRQRRQRAPPVA